MTNARAVQAKMMFDYLAEKTNSSSEEEFLERFRTAQRLTESLRAMQVLADSKLVQLRAEHAELYESWGDTLFVDDADGEGGGAGGGAGGGIAGGAGGAGGNSNADMAAELANADIDGKYKSTAHSPRFNTRLLIKSATAVKYHCTYYSLCVIMMHATAHVCNCARMQSIRSPHRTHT
jgi:hypothetical protein